MSLRTPVSLLLNDDGNRLVRHMSDYLGMTRPDDDEMDETDAKYLAALVMAAEVYAERNKLRKGIWQRSGLKGQIFELFFQAERIFQQVFGDGQYTTEDAVGRLVDSINYGAFALCLAAEENIDGQWPWKKGLAK